MIHNNKHAPSYEGTIVTVDRTSPLSLGFWKNLLIHEDLIQVGPATYDLKDLRVMSHASCQSSVIYRQMEMTGRLSLCLSHHDGEVIVRNPDLYHQVFAGRHLPLWRSAARFEGRVRVPVIRPVRSRPEIDIKVMGDVMLAEETTYYFPPELIAREWMASDSSTTVTA